VRILTRRSTPVRRRSPRALAGFKPSRRTVIRKLQCARRSEPGCWTRRSLARRAGGARAKMRNAAHATVCTAFDRARCLLGGVEEVPAEDRLHRHVPFATSADGTSITTFPVAVAPGYRSLVELSSFGTIAMWSNTWRVVPATLTKLIGRSKPGLPVVVPTYLTVTGASVFRGRRLSSCGVSAGGGKRYSYSPDFRALAGFANSPPKGRSLNSSRNGPVGTKRNRS
jgi:hypothetical protein